jgi:hypothetical protein
VHGVFQRAALPIAVSRGGALSGQPILFGARGEIGGPTRAVAGRIADGGSGRGGRSRTRCGSRGWRRRGRRLVPTGGGSERKREADQNMLSDARIP